MANVNFTYAPNINVGGGGGGGGGTTGPTRSSKSIYDIAPQYGYSEEEIERARRYNEEKRVRNVMEREYLDDKRTELQVERAMSKEIEERNKRQEMFHKQEMNYYRSVQNSLLAINMSLLGVNFSLMTIGMSLKRAGILTEQQYETFVQIQGVLGTIISLTQLILSLQSLYSAIASVIEMKEWSIAAAKVAQYGIMALAAVVVIGAALAVFWGYSQKMKKAAFGAYVPARAGGVPMIVGEANQPEVVAPEPMLRRLIAESGSGSNITIYAIDSKDVRRVLEDLEIDNSRRGL